MSNIQRKIVGAGLLCGSAFALSACGTTGTVEPRYTIQHAAPTPAPVAEAPAEPYSSSTRPWTLSFPPPIAEKKPEQRAERRSQRRGSRNVGKPYQIKGVWYHPAEQPDYDEKGIASWYGDQFHGRSTANGERFDMHGVSAAHKTLPLNSMVEVTNLQNGRSMRLRVNDRGPFVEGRIIDLSRQAANELGMLNQGTAMVRVRYAGPNRGEPRVEVADADRRREFEVAQATPPPPLPPIGGFSVWEKKAPVAAPSPAPTPMIPPAASTTAMASTSRSPATAPLFPEFGKGEARKVPVRTEPAPAAGPTSFVGALKKDVTSIIPKFGRGNAEERSAQRAAPASEPTTFAAALKKDVTSLIPKFGRGGTEEVAVGSEPAPPSPPATPVVLAAEEPAKPVPSFQEIASRPTGSAAPFEVQAAAFSQLANAERARAKLRDAGDVEIRMSEQDGDRVYRVLVRSISDANHAGRVRERVAQAGFPDAMILTRY